MPFIWNDPTYWDRSKKAWKHEKYFFIALLLGFIVASFIMKDEIPFAQKVLFSFSIILTVDAVLILIFQLPLAKIPDYYPSFLQILLRLINVLIGLFAVYYFWTTMIAQYYE